MIKTAAITKILSIFFKYYFTDEVEHKIFLVLLLLYKENHLIFSKLFFFVGGVHIIFKELIISLILKPENIKEKQIKNDNGSFLLNLKESTYILEIITIHLHYCKSYKCYILQKKNRTNKMRQI